MKILVVDDDREMVDLPGYWLKGHGYNVVCAFDGEQAITRWRETLPDLVILWLCSGNLRPPSPLPVERVQPALYAQRN